MNNRTRFLAVVLIAAACINARAAGPIVVESRKPDGTPNVPDWNPIAGKWNTSKNKSRVTDVSMTATNVSVCLTNTPVPAFRVSPAGLQPGTRYKVEVTFSTSSTHGASTDLLVAVSAEGVAASTLPTNTPAFQVSSADTWNLLGSITPSTNRPALTFTYVSGSLSPVSRWYADTIRFTPEPATASSE